MLNAFINWALRQRRKRRARQRVALLEQRLLAHESDMLDMAHFPAPVVQRMAKYRDRLMAQLELAKKLAQ